MGENYELRYSQACEGNDGSPMSDTVKQPLSLTEVTTEQSKPIRLYSLSRVGRPRSDRPKLLLLIVRSGRNAFWPP